MPGSIADSFARAMALLSALLSAMLPMPLEPRKSTQTGEDEE